MNADELIKILLVEDNPGDVRLVQEMLSLGSGSGVGLVFELTHVERLDQALSTLIEADYGLILLDLLLPDSQGLETIQRTLETAPHLPVIVLSGLGDEKMAIEAVKAGAQDYLVKGNVDEHSLPRAIRYAIERKRSKEALRQSEAKLRALFNILPVGISILNGDRQIVETNPALERILDISQEDLLNNKYVQRTYLKADQRPMPPEEFPSSRVLQEQRSIKDVEIGIVKEDGELIWNSVSATPVTFPDWQVVITTTDITKRKQAEQSIKHRNHELALLNRIIAASATNPEPEIILETACRELAQAFELPQAAAALLNDDRTEAVVVAEYLQEGRPSGLNERIPIRNNPSFQHLLIHKGPLIVEDAQNDPRLAPIHDLMRNYGVVSLLILPLIIEGEVVGSLGLDAAESRHFPAEEVSLAWSVADQVAGALARARLTQTQQRLVTAIEQSAESVVITDTSGAILYVNPTFEQITGYSRSEVMGQNPRTLKSGQQDRAFYRELWNTITAGQVWQGQLINQKKDGTLFTEEATISPVRDGNGTITNFVAVKRDVTRELQLEEQYRQSQKMDAIGQLTGGIAHDFNNLLTAINGFAELIYYRLPTDTPERELANKILHSGQRAADLVRQLLAFSRKQLIEPKVVDLNQIVAEMDKMLQRIIGEDIQLQTQLNPELWAVKIDRSQFEQVILNLAVNARDAMPQGGKLTIATSNVVFDDDYRADHLDIQPGDHVLLSISDTGVGMSKEVRDRIFEPFFTTKEKGRGTGLGLATVFGIVKQNKGTIWVYSEEGQGTTFKIYLPRVNETISPADEPRDTAEIPVGNETILLVEDDDGVREFSRKMLQQQSYEIIEARDGPEALELANQHTGSLHLLITDVVLPGMSGKELADQLTQSQPELKVLFISGYTDEAIVHHGVLEPGIPFLQKPFGLKAFARKVREVLGSP